MAESLKFSGVISAPFQKKQLACIDHDPEAAYNSLPCGGVFLFKNPSPRLVAAGQALLVTFLWSTSWVLIKIGLNDLPALTFAGLRYTLAFFCLLPFALQPKNRRQLLSLSSRDWSGLFVLGVLFYALTQGAQYLGLAYLPAATTSLLLNFTSVIVAFMGIAFLAEVPTWLQWGGVSLFIAGILVYFYPIHIPAAQAIGFIASLVGMIANAASSILGRGLNRDGRFSPLIVTTASMGIGAALLLITGIGLEGLPGLSLSNWVIIAWLALVNTAFAFTLWNQTLRTLSAMESSIINGTMLIQIALLAWIFLGETLTPQAIAGMLLGALGAIAVQLHPQPLQRQEAPRHADRLSTGK
jgi:drug/metabolite transporter (DMT)-like permease